MCTILIQVYGSVLYSKTHSGGYEDGVCGRPRINTKVSLDYLRLLEYFSERMFRC